MTKQKRRDFLKLSALSAGFLGLSPALSYSKDQVEKKINALTETRKAHGKSVMGLRTEPIKQVKVAFIGVGSRGAAHVSRMNALYPKAKITAICDIRKSRTDFIMDSLKDTKQRPAVYQGKEDAWKDHAPMCIYSMQQGKHAVTEVPAAFTLDESWGLVDTAEETQRHCMMLENVCYGAEELWILPYSRLGTGSTVFGY